VIVGGIGGGCWGGAIVGVVAGFRRLAAGFNNFQPFIFKWFFIFIKGCVSFLVLDGGSEKIISIVTLPCVASL
jgi:LytS/YehU family sensor histidine kinase